MKAVSAAVLGSGCSHNKSGLVADKPWFIKDECQVNGKTSSSVSASKIG